MPSSRMGDGEGPEGGLESLAAGETVLSGALDGPCEEVRGRQVICGADVRKRWDRFSMDRSGVGVTRVSRANVASVWPFGTAMGGE